MPPCNLDLLFVFVRGVLGFVDERRNTQARLESILGCGQHATSGNHIFELGGHLSPITLWDPTLVHLSLRFLDGGFGFSVVTFCSSALLVPLLLSCVRLLCHLRLHVQQLAVVNHITDFLAKLDRGLNGILIVLIRLA